MRSIRLLLVIALAASLALVTPLFASQPLQVSGPAGAPIGAPAHPEAVLYDQTDSPGSSSFTSQNFEAGFEAYDNRGADDFVVPANTIWTIEMVEIPGVWFPTSTGPLDSVNVWFFTDNAGMPGTQLYEALAVVPANPASPSISVTLTTPAQLGPGTYWMVFQVNMDFATGGQWGWTARTLQSNSAAVWENPGDGFTTGCITWGTHATCFNAPTQPDNLFRLNGTTRIPTAVEVTALDSRTPATTPGLALVLIPAALAVAALTLRKLRVH